MQFLVQSSAKFLRLLRQYQFIPLFAQSVIACALLLGRMMMTGDDYYEFLVWNLFLAWIPYGLALGMQLVAAQLPGHNWLLFALGGLWLLFLPNAPYMMTDLKYLSTMDFTWWYEIGVLMAFVWNGWMLGLVALQVVQNLVRERLGGGWSWLFVLCSISLAGLGVYIGRFFRWNSWDIVFHPKSLALGLIDALFNPAYADRAIGVIGLVVLLYFLSYCALPLYQLPQSRPSATR